MEKYSISQFTPMCKTVPDYGKWTGWQQIAMVAAGPALTIVGTCVDVPNSTCMSEHIPGFPFFDTEAEATEYLNAFIMTEHDREKHWRQCVVLGSTI